MAAFLLLTFATSWILWVPMVLWLRREGRLGVAGLEEPLAGLPVSIGVAWFLGASAPSIIAVILVARDGGLGEFLGRLLEWDVGMGWNVIAISGPLVVGLAAMLIHRLIDGGRLEVAVKRFPLVPVALVAALPFGPLGEELGWRGYLLPRMLDETSGLVAALAIGLVWAAWHIPLFWAPLGTSVSRTGVSARSVGRFLAEVSSASVILTWLYVETAGSLWIAVMFHAAWNADMHRFLFEPLDDDATDRVTSLATAGFAIVALALVVWPGLEWRT